MKTINYDKFEAQLKRHTKVLFYYSGGKDSTALLHALKPYACMFDILWVRTGDEPKSTIAQMERVRKEFEHITNFFVVDGNQQKVIEEYGAPVDVLPLDETALGRLTQDRKGSPKVQPRFACCALVLWKPAQDFAVNNGYTMVIRGQKNSDSERAPVKSGTVDADGLELSFPLENSTDKDVLDYIRQHDLFMSPSYFYSVDEPTSIDCVTCSAYKHLWHNAAYIREVEPGKMDVYKQRMDSVREALRIPLKMLTDELSEVQ